MGSVVVVVVVGYRLGWVWVELRLGAQRWRDNGMWVGGTRFSEYVRFCVQLKLTKSLPPGRNRQQAIDVCLKWQRHID